MVKYIEKRTFQNKTKMLEYTVEGKAWKEYNFNFLEFEEGINEFDLKVKRTIVYNKEEIKNMRVADELAFENNLVFFAGGMSSGFYACRFEPGISSVLSADLIKYEYDENAIHLVYDLYVQDIFIGKYDTSWYITEKVKN